MPPVALFAVTKSTGGGGYLASKAPLQVTQRSAPRMMIPAIGAMALPIVPILATWAIVSASSMVNLEGVLKFRNVDFV